MPALLNGSDDSSYSRKSYLITQQQQNCDSKPSDDLPFSLKVTTMIEKKIRNLEKRKSKLKQVQLDMLAGKAFHEDQVNAVNQLEGVEIQADLAKELLKNVNQLIAAEELKMSQKETSEELTVTANVNDDIEALLNMQGTLGYLSRDFVRRDFLSGENGAMLLTEEQLNLINEVDRKLRPSREQLIDRNQWHDAVHESASFIRLLLSSDKSEVMDKDLSYSSDSGVSILTSISPSSLTASSQLSPQKSILEINGHGNGKLTSSNVIHDRAENTTASNVENSECGSETENTNSCTNQTQLRDFIPSASYATNFSSQLSDSTLPLNTEPHVSGRHLHPTYGLPLSPVIYAPEIAVVESAPYYIPSLVNAISSTNGSYSVLPPETFAHPEIPTVFVPAVPTVDSSVCYNLPSVAPIYNFELPSHPITLPQVPFVSTADTEFFPGNYELVGDGLHAPYGIFQDTIPKFQQSTVVPEEQVSFPIPNYYIFDPPKQEPFVSSETMLSHFSAAVPKSKPLDPNAPIFVSRQEGDLFDHVQNRFTDEAKEATNSIPEGAVPAPGLLTETCTNQEILFVESIADNAFSNQELGNNNISLESSMCNHH